MSKRPPGVSSDLSIQRQDKSFFFHLDWTISKIIYSSSSTKDEERDKLLAMLNSHGQSFMNSFEFTAASPKITKTSKKKRKFQETQEAECIKLDDKLDLHSTKAASPDIVPSASTSKAPDVVVFDARVGTSSQPVVRGKGKGFMSSKITHVQSDSQLKSSQPKDSDEDSEGEISNSKNDKLLHELVHSQLLSNPHAYDTKQGSAQRSRTVAGRLLELANDAKIGRGTDTLKTKENSRHAKRVRLGLLDKAKQREAKALEEAKTLGNYHPSIKKNFGSSGSGGAKRRRERGLALGIGKFRNGALTLSNNDIRSVEGAAPSTGLKKGKGSKRR